MSKYELLINSLKEIGFEPTYIGVFSDWISNPFMNFENKELELSLSIDLNNEVIEYFNSHLYMNGSYFVDKGTKEYAKKEENIFKTMIKANKIIYKKLGWKYEKDN